MDTWLKRIWLVNGLIVPVGLILLAAFIIYAFVTERAYRSSEHEYVALPAGDSIRSVRAVRLGEPRRILGTEITLVPVHYGSGYGPLADSYGISGRGGPVQVTVNVMFLDGNEARLLLDQPAYIRDVNYPRAGSDSLRSWIGYEIAFADSNEDGRLGEDDGLTLALSTNDGRGFKQVLPREFSLDSYYPLNADRILVFASSGAVPQGGRPDTRRQQAFVYNVNTGELQDYDAVNTVVGQAARVLGQ